MELQGTLVARRIQDGLRGRVSHLQVKPKLAIIHISPEPAADTYVRLKCRFGEAIGVKVEVLHPGVGELAQTIQRLNADPAVHGIIIQLPLPGGMPTDQIVTRVDPAKDVDGLNPASRFTTAGPRGIMELLAAYDINLAGVNISLVGTGPLMGAPLQRLLTAAGSRVEAFSLDRPIDLAVLRDSGIVIGATGQPHLITTDMVAGGTIVIDATGIDIDPVLRQRDDIRVTPATGGVGPMTVAALFENLCEAASSTASSLKPPRLRL